MCATCGCQADRPHAHADSSLHVLPSHYPKHRNGLVPSHSHERGTDSVSVSGSGRLISLEQDILAKNAEFAAANRQLFTDFGILVLNLVSSPGSGKTTLLVETVQRLRTEFPVAVVSGDQQTTHDAERIRATGVPAWQINTGKGCHLDAHGISHALEEFPLPEGGVLFIENVGNLVCPADFDLGESAKIVVLSVTEGEDKPLKYANMFAVSQLMLLNKIDLLPYVDFATTQCEEYVQRVNPGLPIVRLSARTGEGMETWLDWICQKQRQVLTEQAVRLEAKLAHIQERLSRTPSSKNHA